LLHQKHWKNYSTKALLICLKKNEEMIVMKKKAYKAKMNGMTKQIQDM